MSRLIAARHRSERNVQTVPTIYRRNSERQVAVFEQQVLPRAEQAVGIARESYATGGTSFTDVIDIQRTLLDVRLMIAEAKTAREKSLAEIERLAGVDIETLSLPATRPTTRPFTASATTTAPADAGAEVHHHDH